MIFKISVCNSPEPFQRSSHFFAATLVYFWLTVNQSYAQSLETAFGQYRALPTPGKFEKMFVGIDQNFRRTVFLWSPRTTKFIEGTIDSSLSMFPTKEHYARSPFDDLFVGDIDGDAKPDALLIHKPEKQISVVLNFGGDTLKVSSVLQLPFEPTDFIVGDFNNDKKPDVLVFNRENPGVVPLFGTGKGMFRQGQVIAPDNFVASLSLAQLNDDNLSDIVFYDWVKSEIHLLYGVGQGKFIDQSTVRIEGELKNFVVTPMSTTANLDLVLFYKKPSMVEVWEGDGLGDFHKKTKILLHDTPLATDIADVNGDGWKDIIVLERSGVLQVFLNTDEEAITDKLDFSAGVSPKDFAVQDFNSDKRNDALILDRDGERLLLYLNAEQQNVLKDSLEFTTGIHPRGIWIGDHNGDGLNDVVLVNSGSSSLALYTNRADEGLSGENTHTIAGKPEYVVFHSLRDSLQRFLISYPQSHQVSFFTIDSKNNSTINAVIPTTGQAEFISWSRSAQELVDFFCYNKVTTTENPSLTLFQQLGSRRFIERNFRLTIPNKLLGAAVDDLNNDGFSDVAYVYRNTVGKYELAVSLGDSSLSFKQKKFSYELPEKDIQKSFFWTADFDKDGALDLLFSFSQQDRIVRLAKGKGTGEFNAPDTIATGVYIEDRAHVQILDFDGDGLLDIMIYDAEKGSIGWLRGKGNRKFEAFQPLVAAPQVSHFAFGDLNGDGIADLAVTLPEKGTLKIYDGKMLLKGIQLETAR
ncbi:MAG: VCBS repeat-containing protein [Ignavibacteriales bacterium]|nr:VCBS repeat-containing protein [Ignavibacteriales bacterium]